MNCSCNARLRRASKWKCAKKRSNGYAVCFCQFVCLVMNVTDANSKGETPCFASFKTHAPGSSNSLRNCPRRKASKLVRCTWIARPPLISCLLTVTWILTAVFSGSWLPTLVCTKYNSIVFYLLHVCRLVSAVRRAGLR